MEVGCVYNDSQMPLVLLKSESTIPCSSEGLESLWVPSSSPSFQGSASMTNFEDVRGENTSTKRPFFKQMNCKSPICNEDTDGFLNHPEKKRRLSSYQVSFLEKSFEVENKLDPERKVQLAKELDLQPRQVAIWFQNRRARYKSKQLEKEFDNLKSSFDKLKDNYNTLLEENEKMKNEIKLLSEKLLQRENGKLEAEQSEKTINPSLDFGQKNPKVSPPDVVPPLMMNCKPEDAASSAKSDVLDLDSPHYSEGIHSRGLMEPTAASSHVFEPDASDFSQDEDDSMNLSQSFLPPTLGCFPKLEAVECYDDLQPNSCHMGFPVQEHGTWFWRY